MTIRKRLLWGFGAILAIMAFLLIVNIFAVFRQYSTRDAVRDTLADVQVIESVRYRIIENRLTLGNYLLSGDLRDEDKTNKGITELEGLLRDGETRSTNAPLRALLAQVEENERGWAEQFAKAVIAKRHQVDSGDATVSDLQIFYLQHDPVTWTNKSVLLLDQASQAVHRAQDESNASASAATLWSAVLTTTGTLFAVVLGGVIAFKTEKSITVPLTHLIEVAHKIGASGDLDQTIEFHQGDEVGLLANNFNKMIIHLKEMASVSAAIAEGQLFVTVQPRSPQDTMAKAFTRMTHGLRELVRQVRDSASQVASAAGQMASASDESAKVSVQAASAIDEVTSTMHEMSVNVQNVVKNTQVQGSSVAETSASIDQMVTSIERVANTAKVLVDISHRSREEARSGMITMDKATEGLNRTSQSIQASSEIIGALGRRAVIGPPTERPNDF